MRFLFLTQYFPPEVGAPQVRLAALARELVRNGHEVEVVTALPNHPGGRVFPEYAQRLYVHEVWEGCSLHRVWMYAAQGTGAKRMLSYMSFTFTSLFGLLRSRRPDWIFVESPPLFLSMTAWIASIFWESPFIFNVADLWPDSVKEMGVLREGWLLRIAEHLEHWSYRKARHVNAVTDGIRDVLIQKKGVPAGKITFLPNGVDTHLFESDTVDNALAQEFGLQGHKVIVYAGTIGFAQGLDVAIDAMALIQPDHPEALLVFLGDGGERERLAKRVADEGISNIRFIPPKPLEFVARLYTVATAGFASLKDLPLFEGARPSKLFPIMASAKPVIYSGRGEGARIVQEANAGWLVSPENSLALADAIRDLLTHPDLARTRGISGRSYVTRNLSWPNLTRNWLEQIK